MTFLIIDNYDSFVHNLARYFELCGINTLIKRNDKITINDIKALNPKAIILSPGPCTPKESGISLDLVKQFAPTIPILGVCLGQQTIAEAFAAPTIKTTPHHGRTSTITHNETGLFQNLPTPMDVGRYHSLTNDVSVAPDLIITAQTQDQDNIPMAIQHKTHPTYGVQFHPESILTKYGLEIIRNFVTITQTAT